MLNILAYILFGFYIFPSTTLWQNHFISFGYIFLRRYFCHIFIVAALNGFFQFFRIIFCSVRSLRHQPDTDSHKLIHVVRVFFRGEIYLFAISISADLKNVAPPINEMESLKYKHKMQLLHNEKIFALSKLAIRHNVKEPTANKVFCTPEHNFFSTSSAFLPS